MILPSCIGDVRTHEIRVTTPNAGSAAVARLALDLGIAEVAVHTVFADGPDEYREVVSVVTATPLAKGFVEALLASLFYDPRFYELTSRRLLAITGNKLVPDITWPMAANSVDMFENLWERSHITVRITYGLVGLHGRL